MTNDTARPKTLVVAAVLLALSLSVSIYGEITFAVMSIDAGARTGFVLGRLLWPALWYGVQVWLLYKLVQGRNWARVSVIVVVALALMLRYVSITSPLAQVFGPAMVIAIVAQTVAELLAVLLLVTTAGYYFSPRASARRTAAGRDGG